jgi:hypothetical protein
MAMLSMVMKIQTVTFSQDRSTGTITTLDLVAPWLLKDHSDFNVNRPGAPQAPDPTAAAAKPDPTVSQPPASTIDPTG